jgi:hypothetical protein
MAKSSQHIQQWMHNRSLLALIPPEYPDWVVTISFYVSLQAVDALLTHDHTSATRHEIRNEILLKTNRYSKIRECYFPLYDLSRTVRYLAEASKWVRFDKIESEVFRRYLYPIEESCLKLMSSDLKLEKIKLMQPAIGK